MAIVDERAALEPKEETLTESAVIGSEEKGSEEVKGTDELFVEDHDAGLVDDETKEVEEPDENKVDEEKAVDDEDDNEVEEKIPETLYQTLKARDPKLLKEIPELRTTIFREQKFSELFPTIEEAEEALEARDVFNDYQRDALEGNPKPILETLQKTDKNAFETYATSFLSSLEEVDEKLYRKTIFPQFKKLFKIAVESGRKEYAIAAQNLNHMIWNNTDVDKDEGLSAPKPREDDDLTKRERAFEQRVYDTFSKDVHTTTEEKLTKTIKSVFAKSNIPELLQSSLTTEVMKRVGTALTNDKTHMRLMDSLWKKARKEGYSPESKDSIKNAYLSRANLIITKIRQTVLAEAKISVKTNNNEKKQEPVRIAAGALISGKSGKIDYKKVDWNKTNEKDFLLQKDVVLKK